MGLFDDVLQEVPKPSVWEKIKGGVKTFGKALIEAPQELGRDIFRLTPEYKELQEQERQIEQTTSELRQRISTYAPERKVQMEEFLSREVPTISKVLPERSARQVIGDIAETALLAVPVPAVTALKGLPWLAKAARGIGIGGAFGGAEALRGEEITAKETAKKVGIGALLGVGAEIGLPLIAKGIVKGGKGVAQVGKKIIPERLKEVGSSLKQTIMSVKSRLSNYYGDEGAKIVDKFLVADENKLLKSGQLIDKFDDAGFFQKWTPEEKANFIDLSTGKVKKAISQNVDDSFKIWDNIRKGIAQETAELGVRVRVRGVPQFQDITRLQAMLKTGEFTKQEFKKQFVLGKGKKLKIKEVPFKPREGYFPQDVLYPTAFKNPEVRQGVIKQAVRLGRVADEAEANRLLDGWIDVVEKQGKIGRDNYFVDWLIKDGQAKTKDEAMGMIMRFWKKARLPKFGKLEYAREINFPFYDYDPQRVITKYLLGAIDRLETVKAFGVKGQELNKLLGSIKRKLGPEAGLEANNLVKAMTGAIERSPQAEKTSLMFRALQVPKLAFSQVVNLGQNVNTLLATDLPSFAKGIASVFTKVGRKEARKTGATLESLIRQTIELGAGGEQKFASNFLKYTGFQLTEKINRTVSANAGIAYTHKTFQKLLKKPTDKYLIKRLKEVGINIESALKRGELTKQELLRAGQKVAGITQFRYRPADFPSFYSSPFGRAVFQFKSFAYNQTIFLKDQIVREFTSKKPGKMFRTLFILGLIFPMSGEIVQDIRSLVTQQKRPTKLLDRYLNDIMSVGGFGILTDMYMSAKWGRLADSLLGPTAGTATQVAEAIAQSVEAGKITPSRARQLLGTIGPLATYPHKFFFPPQSQEGKSSIESLIELGKGIKKGEVPPQEIKKGSLFEDVLLK